MPSAKRKPEAEPVKQPKKKPKTDNEEPKVQGPSKEDKNAKPKSSILTKEQTAFPRGGASVLTPLERKQIRAKAAQDADREQKPIQDLFREGGPVAESDSDGDATTEAQVQVKKRDKKTKKSKKHSESSASGTNPEIHIDSLGYKRITTGSLILGQISSVGSRALTVALPNNLVGYVPLTAVSRPLNEKIQGLLDKAQDEENDSDDEEDEEEDDISLTHYFQVGQYIRVAVTATEQDRAGAKGSARKRLELSVDPSLTNAGIDRSNLATGATVQVSVSSVEDHGLVVDLALEDDKVRGFVPQKHLPSGRSLSDIKTGAVVLCHVIDTSSNNKVVKLSADLQKTGTLKTAPSVDAFLPGTKAEILVDNVSESGLSGKIMGLLDATTDVLHSGSFRDKQAFLAKYRVGAKIPGRLICNFPLAESKKLGFSVLEDLVDMENHSQKPDKKDTTLSLSSTVESASVIRVEPGLGVYLQLDEDNFGFAHISRLSDKKVDSISEVSGPFKVGSEHKARIIEYNPLDTLYMVSLQPSVLQQAFLRYEDVPVGAIAKGTIEKLVVGETGVDGLLITLAEGVTGFVPKIHLSDVKLDHPEKKFREGQVVTCRVLSSTPTRRRVRLTLKKALVNSDQKAWLRYGDIETGDSTVGTLAKVDRNGAVVRFYGPVKAFLPVSEMSEAYIRDATEHFRVGQVVTVNALSIDAAEKRLTVSCRDVNASNDSVETSLALLHPGDVMNGTIFEKSENDILLRLEGSNAIARLTLDHVSDGSLKKRQSAFNKMRVGQKLENILILQVQSKRRLVLASNKQSLIKAAQEGTLLKGYEQLHPDAMVTGYVTNITEDGVFVRFAAEISGLIPKSQVSVENEIQHDFGMTKLQPVTARVLTIDYKGATPRFWLTMRERVPDEADRATEDQVNPGLVKLAEPVDPNLSVVDDLAVGTVTKARIISVKDTQINVELAKDVQGRIDASEVFDDWKDIKDRKKPLKQFSTKKELAVRVLGAHDSRNHRFLPLTHRKGKNTVFELTCKPSTISAPKMTSLTLQDMKVGSSWLAFINNISVDCVWVNISPSIRGRVRAIDLSDDLSLTSNMAQNFPLGSALRVRVVAVDAEKGHLDLTARSDGTASALTFASIARGQIIPGRVTKITDHSIIVQLSEQVIGSVELVDMADNFSEANPAKYQKNDMVRVCVLDVDAPNKKISLSTRPSKVLSSSMEVTDREISSVGQLAVNDIVRGFIRNVADKGVFVTLSRGITAFVRIGHLSDGYLKEWKDHFQRDQLVKGRIIMVDQASGHVQMTLKESALSPDYKVPLTFNDLKVGDIVTGEVATVETFGVFILVDNSERIRGLCHRSEIAEQRVQDATKLFSVGDKVKAKVLKVDPAARKVSFGMKAAYFADPSVDNSESDADSEDEREDGGVDLDVDMIDADSFRAQSEDDPEADADDLLSDNDSEQGSDIELPGEESEDDDSIDADATALDDFAEPSKPTSLSVGGFDWLGLPASGISTSIKRGTDASDSESSETPKKKRKRPEIQVDRTGDLDTDGPQSPDDFERLLLSEPDSSSLWLRYMAFHLSLGDVAQARQIGERALKTITLGLEDEKLNLWTALLNLEVAYNAADADDNNEAVESTFQRACAVNDPQEIHARLTSIYIQSGKHAAAEDLFNRMLKKFGSRDPKVWINYASFLFDRTDDTESNGGGGGGGSGPDRARALLPRALQTLPKFTHFDLTLKFAQLEFKKAGGTPERGRTVFEGLISAFPKRVDLFDVLLDLETHVTKDVEQARAVFARVVGSGANVKLKPKQARHFFKRWEEFERKQADGEESARNVEEVRARAAEWVRLHASAKKDGDED